MFHSAMSFWGITAETVFSTVGDLFTLLFSLFFSWGDYTCTCYYFRHNNYNDRAEGFPICSQVESDAETQNTSFLSLAALEKVLTNFQIAQRRCVKLSINGEMWDNLKKTIPTRILAAPFFHIIITKNGPFIIFSHSDKNTSVHIPRILFISLQISYSA